MVDNTFRPPPPPFIGGRQPYEGRKLAPIQTDASGPIPETTAVLLALIVTAWITQPSWPAQSYNRSVASFAGTEAPPAPYTSKQPARVELLTWPYQRSAPVAAFAGTEGSGVPFTSKQPYYIPAPWWGSQQVKLNPSLLDNVQPTFTPQQPVWQTPSWAQPQRTLIAPLIPVVIVVVDQPYVSKQTPYFPTPWWGAQQRWLAPDLLRPEDNPPFGVKAQQWPYPAPSWPAQSAPRTQPVSVDNPPPYRAPNYDIRPQSWSAQRGAQIAALVTQADVVNDPPFTKREITGPIQITWNWPPIPQLQNFRFIPQGGDWVAPPVTSGAGYPWYYGDDKKRKKKVIPYLELPETPKAKRTALKRSLPATVVAELRAEPLPVPVVQPPGPAQITKELLDRWFLEEEKAKNLVVLNDKAREDLLAEGKKLYKERLMQEEEMLLVSFLAAYYRALN